MCHRHLPTIPSMTMLDTITNVVQSRHNALTSQMSKHYLTHPSHIHYYHHQSSFESYSHASRHKKSRHENAPAPTHYSHQVKESLLCHHVLHTHFLRIMSLQEQP
jgi:hypothetical protein